jgi:hypothetical protein
LFGDGKALSTIDETLLARLVTPRHQPVFVTGFDKFWSIIGKMKRVSKDKMFWKNEVFGASHRCQSQNRYLALR